MFDDKLHLYWISTRIRTDNDGSEKHWCSNCMPGPLDKRLEGFFWDHGNHDHRHIVKNGKITIPTNWILHSWIHGNHIHFILQDSPDRPFDGKIEAGDSLCLSLTPSESESESESELN